jgi:hypothetical protein
MKMVKAGNKPKQPDKRKKRIESLKEKRSKTRKKTAKAMSKV